MAGDCGGIIRPGHAIAATMSFKPGCDRVSGPFFRFKPGQKVAVKHSGAALGAIAAMAFDSGKDLGEAPALIPKAIYAKPGGRSVHIAVAVDENRPVSRVVRGLEC